MNWQAHPAHWHSHTFRAMGCEMAVWIELKNADTAAALLQEAEALFRSAERRLSRFDAASELSQLNAQPGVWTAVSETTWQVITQALFLARETGGLFDPTHLTALEAAGYTRSFEQLAEVSGVNGTATAVATFNQWQTVQLSAESRAIWLPPGVKLDLGGIAKGYTAQQVVNFLSEWGPCLVDASGDLTAGAAPADWPGWPVAVLTPYTGADEPREELFPLWLVEGTMATSGIDYRRWQRNGRAAHHLIDPRTSLPAETDLLTATVLAKTAVRAEAWATAALVAGTEVARQRLTAINLAAALIDQNGGLFATPALEPFLTLETTQPI
ncbi:MAG: FAD:protein FMN transferase [Ardenticatenaceae bacterium]|nr:FAD:protein FMN transferase [Anaerolineales bacterium]MCB8921887.1 FAD:protein FMN transferase [Ardenticatenaceae bacterium]MCB8992205.1 FAD:protein FMN transferase [Ardenticatenaceae bacterium]